MAYQEPFSRSYDKKHKVDFGLAIDTSKKVSFDNDDDYQEFNPLRSPSYEHEVNDMAKTSMFGGHIINDINSAELPISPKGFRLQIPSTAQQDRDEQRAVSNYSVKGSSICQSPSPTAKVDRMM